MRDNVRPRLDETGDDLIIGVREPSLNTGSHPSQRCAKSRLHITWQIEVHQTVGGANLDLRVIVGGGLNQGIQTMLSSDLDDLLYRFQAHFQVGILEELLEYGNDVGSLFGDLAHVFGPDAFLSSELLQDEKNSKRRAAVGHITNLDAIDRASDQQTNSTSTRRSINPASRPRSNIFCAAAGTTVPASNV